jgi:hypothetical protein
MANFGEGVFVSNPMTTIPADPVVLTLNGSSSGLKFARFRDMPRSKVGSGRGKALRPNPSVAANGDSLPGATPSTS